MAWSRVTDAVQDLWACVTRDPPSVTLQLGGYKVPDPKGGLPEPIMDTEAKTGTTQSFTFPTGIALELDATFTEAPTPVTLSVDSYSNLSAVSVTTDPDAKVRFTVDSHVSGLSTLVLRATDANGASSIVLVEITHLPEYADGYESLVGGTINFNANVTVDLLAIGVELPAVVTGFTNASSFATHGGISSARMLAGVGSNFLRIALKTGAVAGRTNSGWVQYRSASGAYGYIETYVEVTI